MKWWNELNLRFQTCRTTRRACYPRSCPSYGIPCRPPADAEGSLRAAPTCRSHSFRPCRMARLNIWRPPCWTSVPGRSRSQKSIGPSSAWGSPCSVTTPRWWSASARRASRWVWNFTGLFIRYMSRKQNANCCCHAIRPMDLRTPTWRFKTHNAKRRSTPPTTHWRRRSTGAWPPCTPWWERPTPFTSTPWVCFGLFVQ